MFSTFSINGSMNGMNKKKIVQGLLLVLGISMSIGLIGVEGAYSEPSNLRTTKDTKITKDTEIEIRRQLNDARIRAEMESNVARKVKQKGQRSNQQKKQPSNQQRSNQQSKKGKTKRTAK